MNRVQIGCCTHDPTPLFFACPHCGEGQILHLDGLPYVGAPITCDDCDTELELLVRKKPA